MSQPPPEEERRHRRGLKFRKREDYAIELFRQAQASLSDVAQVDRRLEATEGVDRRPAVAGAGAAHSLS